MTSEFTPTIARLKDVTRGLEEHQLYAPSGRLKAIEGPIVRVQMGTARHGQMVLIERQEEAPIKAEVIGLDGKDAIVLPFGSVAGLQTGAIVRASHAPLTVAVGHGMLGRVVDAFGQPMDLLGPIKGFLRQRPIKGMPPNAMSRPMISTSLTTGIRSIDGLLTLGQGQRVAIFGGPGGGKSSLVSEITTHTDADVIVIGLVGERGREIREFIERDLPQEKRQRVVIVAASSDRSAIERAICAQTATSIAEHFCEEGSSVLLIVDSLTRTARALREIGLAAGEAPTRRGYPASVYPALPILIERAGCSKSGAITALYTVLVEGEVQNDPIAEEVRSLTDGHIVLSPKLASQGHYPAIDISDSLSRIMGAVVSNEQMQNARQIRQFMAKFSEIELLLQIGEYREGTDALADQAVATMPEIERFLQQSRGDTATMDETVNQMAELLS